MEDRIVVKYNLRKIKIEHKLLIKYEFLRQKIMLYNVISFSQYIHKPFIGTRKKPFFS